MIGNIHKGVIKLKNYNYNYDITEITYIMDVFGYLWISLRDVSSIVKCKRLRSTLLWINAHISKSGKTSDIIFHLIIDLLFDQTLYEQDASLNFLLCPKDKTIMDHMTYLKDNIFRNLPLPSSLPLALPQLPEDIFYDDIIVDFPLDIESQYIYDRFNVLFNLWYKLDIPFMEFFSTKIKQFCFAINKISIASQILSNTTFMDMANDPYNYHNQYNKNTRKVLSILQCDMTLKEKLHQLEQLKIIDFIGETELKDWSDNNLIGNIHQSSLKVCRYFNVYGMARLFGLLEETYECKTIEEKIALNVSEEILKSIRNYFF